MEKPIRRKDYEFPSGERVWLDMDEQTWRYKSFETGYLFGFYVLDTITNEVTDCDGTNSYDVPSAVIAALAMNYDLDLDLEMK